MWGVQDFLTEHEGTAVPQDWLCVQKQCLFMKTHCMARCLVAGVGRSRHACCAALSADRHTRPTRRR
jgi:hypothetical protein